MTIFPVNIHILEKEKITLCGLHASIHEHGLTSAYKSSDNSLVIKEKKNVMRNMQ